MLNVKLKLPERLEQYVEMRLNTLARHLLSRLVYMQDVYVPCL